MLQQAGQQPGPDQASSRPMQDLALLPTQVQILSGAIHDMLAGRQDAADILSLSATRLSVADVTAAPDPGPANGSNAAGVAALQQKVKLLEEQNADLLDELSVSRECLDSTRAELEAAMLLLQNRAPQSAQMTRVNREPRLLPREEPLLSNAQFHELNMLNDSTGRLDFGRGMSKIR